MNRSNRIVGGSEVKYHVNPISSTGFTALTSKVAGRWVSRLWPETNWATLARRLKNAGTHIAIGLNKKIVLFNNIFNRNEFELYGLGEILEPEFDCPCYFTPVCPNNCMQYIYPDKVFETCQKLLAR